MDSSSKSNLNTVSVPENLKDVFLTAQSYVENYFSDTKHDPKQGLIQFSDERYILVRAASMSKEFFDMMILMYKDRGEKEARKLGISVSSYIKVKLFLQGKL